MDLGTLTRQAVGLLLNSAVGVGAGYVARLMLVDVLGSDIRGAGGFRRWVQTPLSALLGGVWLGLASGLVAIPLLGLWLGYTGHLAGSIPAAFAGLLASAGLFSIAAPAFRP